jgi:arylsulfatase A-like enzyme/HEAT repeat protein
MAGDGITPPPNARGAASSPGGGSSRTALWLKSGILAGALAGAIDASSSVFRGIGGLSADRAVGLIALDASLIAAVGGALGLLCAVGGWIASRTRAPAWWGAALAALGAAPLVIFDAFALFSGHQAASVPGHAGISVALAVGGLGAVFGLARRYLRRLAGPPTSLRAVAAVALLALGIGAELANRSVLPRLYGWFHLTLAVMTVVSLLLGVRLLTGAARSWRVGLFAAVTAAACLASTFELRRSQILRYAAHERTALASLALRAVPDTSRPHTLAAGERRAAEGDLPPLPEGPRRPEGDVLVVTIDALRADHVGAYGYPRHTTPNLDALAATGTRFSRAYAQAPHTSFSVASMMTGKYFPTLARLAPGERHDPIAAVLRNYGWKTAAFYPPAVFFVDSEKLKTYAQTNFDFEYVKFEYIDAQRRVDQLLRYYDAVEPKRSFVWVHFFEPHEPYEAHAEFPFGAGDLDRYDSEIAYTDHAVGRLIAEVRARRPGTIVIVAADHGEEFGEHGGRYHGSSLYDEQLRIPLIVSIPGVPPHVVDGQVELIDVTPTVLNLLDIPVPARMRGTDLGPWLATPPAPPERLPPAFAELEDKRMVVLGPEKLLCDLHWGFCAYYDLGSDPHERHNLAEERPARAAFMRGLLDDWLDGHVRLEPLLARGASNPEGGPVPRALDRGRLGDLSAAPELAALLNARAPLSQRREAATLLVNLPPRPETAAAFAQATSDNDRVIADWAAVGSLRLGDTRARARVAAINADPSADGKLRVRAALALATAGEAGGIPVLADALDHCDDVLLCRVIIVSLGKLRDRRAVPILLKHLPEVQNRREMVDALGEIGDPSAEDALVERLHSDGYVTVRVGAAKALARIGDRQVVSHLQGAVRHETEPEVIAAAREAADQLSTRTP